MKNKTLVIALLIIACINAMAKPKPKVADPLREAVNAYFDNYQHPQIVKPNKVKVLNVVKNDNSRQLSVYTNETFAGQPFSIQSVENIYAQLRSVLPEPYNSYNLIIYGNGTPIQNLICEAWGYHPGQERHWHGIEYKGNPWVANVSRPYSISQGLEGRHLSVASSHGKFYKISENEWQWQRPHLFLTTEDLFTQTIVVPYLIPMLENAGAIVFTPRERDWQRHEVIVDNNTPTANGLYSERQGLMAWSECADSAFAQLQQSYDDLQNPFRHGTARQIAAQPMADVASYAFYQPLIPEDGSYAVYVSYVTQPNSVSDALYTVRHQGIDTQFRVNQQMGGRTWVYLGNFDFKANDTANNCVFVSNESRDNGVVTTDAVRFGGGMGNTARNGLLSGVPRFLEAARYTAQWYGMPYEVYGNKMGKDDYSEDINTRSLMTNHLARGSVYLPCDTLDGLHVPLELSLAVHSDAGYTEDDSHIGTLAIYTSDHQGGRLPAGQTRLVDRDLCDMLLTGIDRDMSRLYGHWQRRQMYDRNYSESREPQIPGAILETLSHQNYADMLRGHDPNFKFHFARAIYKAILQYVSYQHQLPGYTVQPLPIADFCAQTNAQNGEIELSWMPQDDPLEPTAMPAYYLLQMAKEGEGWDNGRIVEDTRFRFTPERDKLYRFRVLALNAGGSSMPSEELCAMLCSGEGAKSLLIVNGFQRLAAPQAVDNPTQRGFDINQDPGVAYMRNPGFAGRQQEFYRNTSRREGAGALGFTSNELEGMIIAGNTFDYPTQHARILLDSDCRNVNISSSNRAAVEHEMIDTHRYSALDLILGAQRKDNYSSVSYKTFTPELQTVLTHYLMSGGNVFVSGAYVASDMTSEGEQQFTARMLHYQPDVNIHSDNLLSVTGMNTECSLLLRPNEQVYSTAHVDALRPMPDAFSTMLYQGVDNKTAAVAYQGKDYRTLTLGFPLEMITNTNVRMQILRAAFDFLTQ